MTIFNNSVITYVHVKDVIDVIVRALEKENNIGEKYLVGKEQLSLKELNKMVEEISGTPLPKICLPDSVSMATAVFLTRIADLIKQPPMLGIAIEHFRILKEGMRGDGSKVEKEMGITYTPIRAGIEEAVLSYAT